MGENNSASKSPHQQGQLEFLKARLSKKKPNDDDKRLNHSVRVGVFMQRIVLHPNENENTAAAETNLPVDTSMLETPSSILSERLLPWAASSGAQVAACLRNPLEIEPLMDCLKSLQGLRQALQNWEDELSVEWRPAIIPNPRFQINSSGYTPAYLVIFPNINISSVWTCYYVTQLSVLTSLATICSLDSAASISGLDPLEVQASLVAVADTICSTVPYMLGLVNSTGETIDDGDTRFVKALFVTRSLFLAVQVSGLPDAQVQWILDTLEFIGRERGFGHALAVKRDLAVRHQMGVLGLSHLS
jgi:hypothetical protein